jgi:hypothetical protein
MGSDAGGDGCLGAGAETPRFRVWTVANTRQDHQIGARTADEFERVLAGVAWFAHLGEPSPWDGGCERISAWEQWPGPHDLLDETFHQSLQGIHDGIFAACSPTAADGLQVLFDRVSAAVRNRAAAAVPLYDPEEDSWYAPTLCVWSAGYVGALIACVLACGWPVPEDLVEMWNWYEAGHWPSSFAGEPGDPVDWDPDDPVDWDEEHPVSPRRLLVY